MNISFLLVMFSNGNEREQKQIEISNKSSFTFLP